VDQSSSISPNAKWLVVVQVPFSFLISHSIPKIFTVKPLVVRNQLSDFCTLFALPEFWGNFWDACSPKICTHIINYHAYLAACHVAKFIEATLPQIHFYILSQVLAPL